MIDIIKRLELALDEYPIIAEHPSTLFADAISELRSLSRKAEEAEAVANVLSDEYERNMKTIDGLREDVKTLETILAKYESLGKEYERQINQYYFYKDSKLYEAREDRVEAGGGQSDPEQVGSRRRRIEEIDW